MSASTSNRSTGERRIDSELDVDYDLGSSLGSDDIRAIEDEIQSVSPTKPKPVSADSISRGRGQENRSRLKKNPATAIPAPVFYAKTISKQSNPNKSVLFSPSPIKESTPPRPRSPSPLSPHSKEIKAKKEALARDLFPEDDTNAESPVKHAQSQEFPDPFDLAIDWSPPTQLERELWRQGSSNRKEGKNSSRSNLTAFNSSSSGVMDRITERKSSSGARSRILSAEDEDAIEDWVEEDIVLSGLDNLDQRESRRKEEANRERERETLIEKGGKGKLDSLRGGSNPSSNFVSKSNTNGSGNFHKPSTPVSIFQGRDKPASEVSSRTSSFNSGNPNSSSHTMSLSKLGSKSLTLNHGTPSNFNRGIGSSNRNNTLSSSATSASKSKDESKKRSRPCESSPDGLSSSTFKPRNQSDPKSASPKEVINLASSDSEKGLSPEKREPMKKKRNDDSTPSNQKFAKTLTKTTSSGSLVLNLSGNSNKKNASQKGKGRDSTPANSSSSSPKRQRQGTLNFVRVPSQKELHLKRDSNPSEGESNLKSKGKGRERQTDNFTSKKSSHQDSDDEFAILSQDPSSISDKKAEQNPDREIEGIHPTRALEDGFQMDNDGPFDAFDHFNPQEFDHPGVDYDQPFPQLDENQAGDMEWEEEESEGDEDENLLDFQPSPERIGKRLVTLDEMDEERRQGFLRLVNCVATNDASTSSNVGNKTSREKGTTKGKTWEATWGSQEEPEEEEELSQLAPPSRTTTKKFKTSWGANTNFRGRSLFRGRARGSARGRGTRGRGSGKTRGKK